MTGSASSQLLLFITLLWAWQQPLPVAAASSPEDEQLRCPDLSADLVCNAAESGFDYDDGCNSVTCMGQGRASTTLVLCPAPETSDQRRRCERLARATWRRLGPFTCPSVDPSAVCERRGAGFAFSDGCNRVRCLRGGGHAGSRMACPVTDPEGPYCRFAIADIVEAEAAAVEEPKEEPETLVEPKLQCPALHYSRVCAEFLPRFSYHDGCRQVTCVTTGMARVPGERDCPEPAPGDAEGAAYCAEAEQRMLEKKSRSRFFTTCLQADSVCRGSAGVDLAFNDGCNRCFCLPDLTAACTRVACPPRFLTPEEFSLHCRRVGAGILSQKKKKK